jgi:hypothetical protein
MSDTTSDTAAIDDKKTTSSSQASEMASNIGKFLTTVILLVIIISLYFSYGGLILYACKLGQSNILPTDTHCYPYTNQKPDVEAIQTNIFTTFTDPPLSMKMNFPYDTYNSSNKLLDLFRKYKEEPHSNFLINYFIAIIESLLSFNYTSINYILNMLNGLPEMMILLFGPFIISFISTFIFLIDSLYLMYLWFAKMGWFFKTNHNKNPNHKADWKDVTILEPINYVCSIAIVILFLFLFWILLLGLPVLPILTMGWCLFSCVTYKARINEKTVNSLNVIQDMFKYYKVTIMSIFSFFVVISAFSNLGALPGVFSIVTLILIYWGIIGINIFDPISKQNLSALVSSEQAKKVCNFKEPIPDKHGLLYHLLFGQSGGDMTKELKKIGKKLRG